MSQLFEDLPVLVRGGLWVIGCDSAIEGSSVLEGAEDVNTETWERALAGAVGTEAVDEAREESEEGAGRGGGVGGGGGAWKGAGIGDSGCRGPRGVAQAGVVARAPRPQCVSFGCLEGREASASGSHQRRGQTGSRLRRQVRGAVFTRGRLGNKQTWNQVARRTQALALGGVRSEGLQSRPCLERRLGLGWSLPASELWER